MALTGRVPATALLAIGALGAGIAGTVGEAPGVAGVAWASLAAVALSLMLHGTGLRVLAVVLVLLAIAGAALALGAMPWAIAGFLLVVLGAVLLWRHGPSWAHERVRRSPEDDPWKRMDAGEDPTI